jgi:hypothetical protein
MPDTGIHSGAVDARKIPVWGKSGKPITVFYKKWQTDRLSEPNRLLYYKLKNLASQSPRLIAFSN